MGGGIELPELPPEDEGRLRAYVGSVAVDSSGCYVAATSPKGGVAGLWSLMGGNRLGGFAVADVCGLAPEKAPACFWETSGLGDVVKLRASEAGFAAEAHRGRLPPSTKPIPRARE